MTRRLVLGYLIITLLVLSILEIPLGLFYSQREEERLIFDAERDAVVLASFYEDVLDQGFEPVTDAAEAYARDTTARIVVLDTSGISLVDTDATPDRDFSTRPEVATALTGVRAAGIRRSNTLDTDLLYVAVPVASGGTVHGALRLTLDANEVADRVRRFWLGLGLIAAVVVAAVGGIGWAVARSVTRPLRELEESAARFADGDLAPATVDPDAPEEIRALKDAMNAMAIRLETLIGRQRDFVADASHQLRTPLTALRLRLENLDSRIGGTTGDAEIAAAAAEIERLSTLVTDLLQLARADQYPKRATIDITPLVADRVDTWAASAAECGVELRLLAPSRPLWSDAIPGAVEQLLDNTLDNAVRFSPTGGAVDITVVPGKNTNKIVISDTGPGLSAGDKERAFQRFWRAEPGSAGSGLGLPIAQSLVKSSGGTMELRDTPGGGLTVVFGLPAGGLA